VTVNNHVVFTPHTQTHTHTHTRAHRQNTHTTNTLYWHLSNSKAATSSCIRRVPRYCGLKAIRSIFQVRKIVDMDITSRLASLHTIFT